MIVVLLAQAGRRRFLHEAPNSHSRKSRACVNVDFDWEEEAASEARHRQARPGAERTHLWIMQPARAPKYDPDR